MDATKSRINGWVQNIATGVAQGLGQALFNTVANGVRSAVGEIGKAIQATSDLTETMSKVGVVFGQSSQEVLDWSKDSATAFGLSQKAALEATSSIANMFIQMGEGQEQAAGMSQVMVELAADIASFNNVAGGAEEVLADMQSAFRGEYDPIQKYIPMINAATVQQQALAESGKESAKELTFLDKALATQTLIMQGAGAAAGDFARTMGEVANQQRIAAAQTENLRAQWGQAFTPIYAEILRGFNLLLGQVSEQGAGIIQALATGMVNGIIYLLPAIRTIRDIFTYWFETHSPPRILPQLAKWGADTINAWLMGMTKADFNILKDLGGSIEGILRSYVGTGQIRETDIVGRVFGSTTAIARAIDEWRRAGTVSRTTLDDIRRSAGPAGEAVGGLVEAYFDLQKASREAARAQDDLNRVTDYYDRALSPIQDKLDDLQGRQRKIREDQQLAELGRTMTDPNSTMDERRLARLEAEEIRVRRKMDAVAEERDTALDAEKKKLDAAKKDEQAKQDAYDAQQAALDQQLKINSLIGEQITLEQRLADQEKAERLAAQNKALAEQEKALRELEAEQRKAEAADKARLAELERVYQASLRYNLATTDTAGKIALMRLELGRYKEGSAEYFDILTQIAGLEEQLNREREAAAKKAGAGGGAGLLGGAGGILGKVEDLGIEDWAKDLGDKLHSEIDKWLGTKPPLDVRKALGLELAGSGAGTQAGGGISQEIKDFVKALDSLKDAIFGVTPALTGLAEAFGLIAPASQKAGAATNTETSTWLQRLTSETYVWAAIFGGDWQTFWDALREHAKLTGMKLPGDQDVWLDRMLFQLGAWIVDSIAALNQWRTDYAGALGTWGDDTDAAFRTHIGTWGGDFDAWFLKGVAGFETWLGDVQQVIIDWDLSEAGSAFVKSLWTGMSTYWTETVEPWWEEKTKWIADLLPGSEPKNPLSPLRGLEHRGAAIVGNLQKGMEAAAAPLQAQFASSLAGIASTSMTNSGNTTSNSWGPIELHFHGGVTEQQARNAANTIQTELRRRGAPV